MNATETNVYRPVIGDYSYPCSINLSPVDWRQGMLIRSTNWLGDAVMALPGVYRLCNLVPPGGRRTVLAPEKLAGLWHSVPWIDQVITFAGRRLSAAERRQVRATEPGVSVVLPNSFGAAWDLWRSGGGYIVGRSGRGRNWLLRGRLPEWRRRAGHDKQHEVRKYLEFAAACGSRHWHADYPVLEPQLTDEARAAMDALVPANERLLVIAPGAAYGPAKQWPVDHFNAVAKWWTAQCGRVIVCGAMGEEAVAMSAIADCPGAVSIAGKSSVAQLMYVLAGVDCVLTNDSGAMHLAAGLGKDGVAIFGSTDPVATGPIGGRWMVMRHPLPCSPCLQRTCPRTDIPYECLKTIAPQNVIDSIEYLIS